MMIASSIEALGLKGASDEEAGAVGQLLERRGLRVLQSLARLQLGGLRLTGLQGELGEVEVELDRLQLLRRHAHEQLLGGGAQSDAEIGEHLEVRATLPGLDARDVPDRHICAGEIGLGHALGHARGAQPLAEYGRVDLPQQVRLSRIHVRQCD